MARNFRRHRAAHPIAELNVTNLIALGFMLLIIFMIATPLIQNEQTMNVNLPTTTAIQQTKADSQDKFEVVGVDRSGRFFVGENGQVVPLAELQGRLRVFAGMEKPPVVRIRGDKDIQYEKVMQLTAEVMKAGLSRVTFDALRED